MNFLLYLQIVHVVSGSVWLGGFIFIYFILWPSLIEKDQKEALSVIQNLKRPTGTVLGIAGTVSIALGLLRGIVFGNISSVNALFTPYGRNFIGAVLISIVMLIFGKIFGHSLVPIIWENGIRRKFGLLKIYAGGSFLLLCFAFLIFCMLAMRLGGI